MTNNHQPFPSASTLHQVSGVPRSVSTRRHRSNSPNWCLQIIQQLNPARINSDHILIIHCCWVHHEFTLNWQPWRLLGNLLRGLAPKRDLQAMDASTGIWEGGVSRSLEKSNSTITVNMCDEHGSYIGGHDANHSHSLHQVSTTAAINLHDMISVS